MFKANSKVGGKEISKRSSLTSYCEIFYCVFIFRKIFTIAPTTLDRLVLIIGPTFDSWVYKHLALHDGIVGNMLGLAMIDTFLIGSRKILKLVFSLVCPTSLMGLGITI